MTADNTQDFASLFLNDIPLMDVRAPIEFNKGSFPQANNLPLLNDQEREAVGTCYKTKGSAAAISLGYRLMSDDVLGPRQQAWADFTQANPTGYLYCFRGGLRSQLVQQNLYEQGIHYPLVIGGYKAMRHYLLTQLRVLSMQSSFVVIAGRTGAGKTKLIEQHPHSINLERLANHKGSSFGKQATPQPTQIDFENQLAIALMKSTASYRGRLLIEDEGKLIGQRAVPLDLRQALHHQPVIIINTPLEERITNIINEYIIQPLQQCCQTLGDAQGWQCFRQAVLDNLGRIKIRLGGLRFAEMSRSFEASLLAHQAGQPSTVFSPWVSRLLLEYYDPMYDYQLSKSQRKVLLEGSVSEVAAAITGFTYPQTA